MDPLAYDWSRFVLRVGVSATRDRIIDAWTTPVGLESWFLRSAAFVSADGTVLDKGARIGAGDAYVWHWHGHDDEVVERGRILATADGDVVRFEFGVEGVVTVRLRDDAGETVVELTQEQIPTAESDKVKYHLGCSNGWTFYLANLKSVLEGGIDLRNKNLNLKNVINA